MTTALATVGAGATSVNHRRKVPRNKSGLSYKEWLNNAGVSSSQKHFAMWREDKNIGAASEAKDNPISGLSTGTKVGLAVGGTVLLLAALTGGIYLYKNRASATPYGCKAGQRYQVIISATAGSVGQTLADPAILAGPIALLTGSGAFKNVSTPALSGNALAFMMDCTKTVDAKPAFASMLATGYSVTFVPLGATPAGA